MRLILTEGDNGTIYEKQVAVLPFWEMLWLLSTILGVYHIKKKNLGQHNSWMTRSFLLSFANMTIYIIVAITHHL
jgi:hypothetical protein